MKVYSAIPMLKVTWNTIAHVVFVYLNIFLAFQQQIHQKSLERAICYFIIVKLSHPMAWGFFWHSQKNAHTIGCL